jgi:chromate transporter
VLAFPSAGGQVSAIAFGGAAGFVLFRRAAPTAHGALPYAVSKSAAIVALALFFMMLIALPLAAAAVPSQSLRLFDAFFRAGSLVFGGAHVVLPLLQASVVPPGWVTNEAFLAGYGAAQAVPGPLFTFSAYLGTVMQPQPNGWSGAILCLAALFLPSFLLVIGALPFWDELRGRTWAQSALYGINAAVVGILLAALYNPVWTAGVNSAGDFALVAAAFLLLFMWQNAALAGRHSLCHRRRRAGDSSSSLTMAFASCGQGLSYRHAGDGPIPDSCNAAYGEHGSKNHHPPIHYAAFHEDQTPHLEWWRLERAT